MPELMFSFITHTANPLGGKCYNCSYCYIHGRKGMKKRFKHIRDKYSGEYRIYENVLKKRYKAGDFVFFCDCIDYLNNDVPSEFIREIYEWIEKSPRARFLSLTKNPERYFEFRYEIPHNVVLGSTIETDIDYDLLNKILIDILISEKSKKSLSNLMRDNIFRNIKESFSNITESNIYKSDAPSPNIRIKAMMDITNSLILSPYPRFISIEPILKFSSIFGDKIKMIVPSLIAIGYDNHNNKLPEPSIYDTMGLINYLKNIKYQYSSKPKIIRKTIRRAWWE